MAKSYCEMRDILSDYIHLDNYIPKEPLYVELAVIRILEETQIHY